MSFLREELQRYDGKTSARVFASHVHRFRAFIDAEQPEKHSEADWLAKIVLHLDGTAAEYYEYMRLAHGPSPFATVEDLLQQLIRIFNPEGSEVNPRDQLDRCHQRGPVQGYIKEVMGIIVRIPDMGPADAKHRFISGLKPALQKAVIMYHPASLEEAIKLAADADLPVYACERAKRYASSAGFAHPSHPSSSSSSGGYAGHTYGPGQQGHNHPVPMEIGSAAAAPPAAAGGAMRPRCALCKREGHVWQQCRRKMDYTCSVCGGRGHPGNFCRNRPNGRGR
jgi:hypothetical protein